MLMWKKIPGFPHFSVLQAMETWVSPGNKANTYWLENNMDLLHLGLVLLSAHHLFGASLIRMCILSSNYIPPWWVVILHIVMSCTVNYNSVQDHHPGKAIPII